ncbi:MAG: hypothetical protein EA392_03005 [Cryomorphaceae bacterium]|nr:MAG: hypothetical protein EA392_03005 [Cryomorphaceae bacterium]
MGLFFTIAAHAQKGEWYTGIHANAGVNPAIPPDFAGTWSAAGGLFVQHQLSDYFGLMFSPAFRYTATYLSGSCGFIIIASHPCSLQRNVLELPLALTFRLPRDPSNQWQAYLLLGYSPEVNLFDRGSYVFGGGRPDTHIPNFYLAAHNMLFGFEFRVRLGEKAGCTMGMHYTAPFLTHHSYIGRTQNSHYEFSMLAVHLRFGGLFGK